MNEMEIAQDLHRHAMNLAEQADLARIRGLQGDLNKFLKGAFEAEKRAALSLKNHPDAEPTRSVLFRSAATLALECGDLSEVASLTLCGLRGSPPQIIEAELRGLLREVREGLEPSSAGPISNSLRSAAEAYRAGNPEGGELIFNSLIADKSAEFIALAYDQLCRHVVLFRRPITPGKSEDMADVIRQLPAASQIRSRVETIINGPRERRVEHGRY